MDNIFKIICKKCDGQCCRKFDIFLTERELENLKEFKDRLKITKENKGFLMEHKEDRCFFLNPKTGCILKDEQKPFDCRLFPLTFIYKDKKIKFYLIKYCSYLDEINQEWIENTKKQVLKELETWTEDDKLVFSKIIEESWISELKEI